MATDTVPEGTLLPTDAWLTDAWGASRKVRALYFMERLPGGPAYIIEGYDGISEGIHVAEPKDLRFREG